MMKFLIVQIAFLMAVYPLFSQSSGVLQSANEAYQQSDYQKAIAQYEQLLSEGYQSEAIHYNLANSYYQARQLGKAILHYERALLFNPANEDIRFNLAVAKQNVKGEIDPVPPFFLKSWWLACRNLVGSTTWALLALLLLWAGMAGLSLWQLGRSRKDKKRGFLTGAVLLGLSILPLALGWSAYRHQADTGEGVLTVAKTGLRSGADEASQEIRQIHEGTHLELLDQISVWYKVRLENGETGWLRGDSFEEI